ncbi:MAG: sulfotransferase [Acidobacteriota bacterium]|nr:sulfotransferase [Acidobacteriota bacterium]
MNRSPNLPPFFVLGAARSGTTLLRLMLNRHSRLAIPAESHFLLDVLEEMPVRGLLDQKQAARMASIIIGHPRFRHWHVDAAALAGSLMAATPAPLSELIDLVFRMEVGAGMRWGDKTPRYYGCWEQLAHLFPKSCFVHIIRDGRDVSNSLKQVGWHGRSEEERADYWRTRVEMARRAQVQLGPRRNLIIRYEDLVMDSRAILKKVCAFLGETYEPDMLGFYEDAPNYLNDFDGPVHDKLTRPPKPDDIGRWQKESSRESLVHFEAVAGNALRLFSYPPSFPVQ